MAAPFGFSAGDFIAAIQLIGKITKSLSKVGGASNDYQHTIIELDNLNSVLQTLRKLEPSSSAGQGYVNAIRGMALACQLPLIDFYRKIEKYEATHDHGASRFSLLDTSRKVKWAIKMDDEVQKFRALVVGKVVSINLLLQSYAIKEADTREKARLEDSNRLFNTIEANKSEIEASQTKLLLKVTAMENSIKALEKEAVDTKATVLSMRSVGEKILSYLMTFPTGLRQIVGSVIQTSLSEHRTYLQHQQNLPPDVLNSLNSGIIFTDALDRCFTLPYEHFRSFEMLETFLSVKFKELPGEHHVKNGQFKLFDIGRNDSIVSKLDWSKAVFPGSRIRMGIVMSHLKLSQGSCPRPRCGHQFAYDHAMRAWIMCPACNLRFEMIPRTTDESENDADQMEIDNVVQQQLDEDSSRFGRRFLPNDISENGFNAKLDFAQPSKDEQIELREDNLQMLIKKTRHQAPKVSTSSAIGWNAGSTPMNA